jgi:hypothetical protein
MVTTMTIAQPVDIDEQMSFGLLKKMRGNDVEALGN